MKVRRNWRRRDHYGRTFPMRWRDWLFLLFTRKFWR